MRRQTPDPDRLVPRECEWTQKGGDWAQRMACNKPPTILCTKQLREKFVCGRHAGTHKRLTPTTVRCTEADHAHLGDLLDRDWTPAELNALPNVEWHRLIRSTLYRTAPPEREPGATSWSPLAMDRHDGGAV